MDGKSSTAMLAEKYRKVATLKNSQKSTNELILNIELFDSIII